MKRKVCFVLAALLFALILTGCRFLCRHDWMDATCEAPETCSRCGQEEGEPLRHDWEKATCEQPKTCALCGQTQGKAKEHRFGSATCTEPKRCIRCGQEEGTPAGHTWQEATCETPRTCQNCDLTEGNPLEHVWKEATTEAPKTCMLCQLTEGLPLVTDERFTTAETAALQGAWMTNLAVDGAAFGEPGFTGVLKGSVRLEFGNTGILSIRVETENMEAFEQTLFHYAKQKVYAEFAAKGIGEGAADLAIRAAFGVTTDEYVAQILEQIDIPGILTELTKDRVYYAQGNTVYIADDWNSAFTSSTYRFREEVLIFDAIYVSDPMEPLQWYRVAE